MYSYEQDAKDLQEAGRKYISNKHFLDYIESLLQCFNFSDEVRRFICCQSALETGFGTSLIYTENFNLFGMKEPTIRPTSCVGSANGHAKYNSYFDSAVDYMLWLSWTKPLRFRLRSMYAFADHLLNCHYAEDKDYISKILKLYKKYYG